MTAWSRRVNAAAHRGVGEKAEPKPDLFAEATAAEVDADGMATLKTLIALARERPSFAVTVEVATAKKPETVSREAKAGSGGAGVNMDELENKLLERLRGRLTREVFSEFEKVLAV